MHIATNGRAQLIHHLLVLGAQFLHDVAIGRQNAVLLEQQVLDRVPVVVQLAQVLREEGNSHELHKTTPKVHHAATRIVAKHGPCVSLHIPSLTSVVVGVDVLVALLLGREVKTLLQRDYHRYA